MLDSLTVTCELWAVPTSRLHSARTFCLCAYDVINTGLFPREAAVKHLWPPLALGGAVALYSEKQPELSLSPSTCHPKSLSELRYLLPRSENFYSQKRHLLLPPFSLPSLPLPLPPSPSPSLPLPPSMVGKPTSARVPLLGVPGE